MPPRWMGASSIRLAHQLNEQCIDLLCDIAIESPRETLCSLLALNRDLWIRLDGAARKRLALFPFVIADVRFKDVAWWLGLSRQQPAVIRAPEVLSVGGVPCCDHLALETLMFAWQLAREDRRVAQIVFGMAPAVADCIGALTMQQVRITAGEGVRFFRVRWDDQPQFWRELLISAREEDEAALIALRRDAKLLFCGELIQGNSP